jgi:hypothetical protein
MMRTRHGVSHLNYQFKYRTDSIAMVPIVHRADET